MGIIAVTAENFCSKIFQNYYNLNCKIPIHYLEIFKENLNIK